MIERAKTRSHDHVRLKTKTIPGSPGALPMELSFLAQSHLVVLITSRIHPQIQLVRPALSVQSFAQSRLGVPLLFTINRKTRERGGGKKMMADNLRCIPIGTSLSANDASSRLQRRCR